MFRHVVMFQWAEAADDSQRRAAVASLREWAEVAEEFGTVSIGTDAGLNASNFDVAVVGDFPDQAAYEAYAADHRHVRLVREEIAPLLGTRAAVQCVL